MRETALWGTKEAILSVLKVPRQSLPVFLEGVKHIITLNFKILIFMTL
jgi:hypothetical protein